jgi:hypothetical protein
VGIMPFRRSASVRGMLETNYDAGETAFRSFLSGETGTEALLIGRLEQSGTERNLRIKLGVGHALVPSLGAAQWRVVFGVELLGHK